MARTNPAYAEEASFGLYEAPDRATLEVFLELSAAIKALPPIEYDVIPQEGVRDLLLGAAATQIRSITAYDRAVARLAA